MKPMLRSAIVVLGTLIAAALIAFGEPGAAEVQMAVQTPAPEMVVSLLGLDD